MKRVLLLFLSLVFVLLGVGCVNTVTYFDFKQSHKEIINISIREVEKNLEYEAFKDSTILKEIDIVYAEELYKDVESIPMHRDSCFPNFPPAPGGVIIVMEYKNQDVQIISLNGSNYFTYMVETNILSSNPITDSFYEEEYNTMIEKYLNM